ncbi:MAG: T9SS type A sorting domain-containing protein [Ignavibacteria bacterium]|nr:T9SS type A sorting domain-containing protein [Ignavibacteria bacterium]
MTFVRSLDGWNIWSLAYNFNNGSVYAGSTGSTARIFRTTNNAVSWDTVASGNGQTIFSMAFDSLGNMYVANNNNGLLKSTNGGLNFLTITTSVFEGSAVLSVACSRKGYVYVGTNNAGVFRSTDTANTFTNVLPSLQVIVIKTDKFNPSILYVGTASATPGPNGFYRSTDWGATFSANLNPNKSVYDINQRNAPMEIFSVATTSPGYVDRSTDGGLNWINISSGYVFRGLTSNFQGVLVAAGNGGVFYSTNNGATFSSTNITSSSTPVIYFIGTDNWQYIFAGVSTSAGGQNGVWVWKDPIVAVRNDSYFLPFEFLNAYPNPFNPKVRIRFALHSESYVKFILTNANGETVMFKIERFQTGINETEFDLRDFPSGIYFCKLESQNYSKTIKLAYLK